MNQALLMPGLASKLYTPENEHGCLYTLGGPMCGCPHTRAPDFGNHHKSENQHGSGEWPWSGLLLSFKWGPL